MKIALLFDDRGYENQDFSKPKGGNPGIGGTHYMYLLLAEFITKRHSDIDLSIVHYRNNILPTNCRDIIVGNEDLVFDACIQNEISFLVHQTGKSERWYETAFHKKINLIVWAQCYLGGDELTYCSKYKNVKKVVFVGKQEYDRYIDCEIISKCTYIFNMFCFDGIEYCHQVDNNIVVYMGSITKEKGFHVLAKQWKKVLRSVPDAQLYVIGSGSLYSRESKLGDFQIAEDSYEKQFIGYLLDKEGHIDQSIHFLGIVGPEKTEIFGKAKVGVVNPTAVSETFCISAIEMQCVGLPVVTKRALGLCDTNKNKITGLTYLFEKSLSRCIIKLLNDNSLNEKISRTARGYAKNTFDVNTLVEKWYDLFLNLEEEQVFCKPNDYFWNDFKWLRIINRYFRTVFGYSRTVSVEEWKEKVKRFIRKR